MKRFGIRDLFWTTTVSAVLVAVARTVPEFFLALLCFGFLGISCTSVFTLLLALVCAKSEDNRLVPETIPMFGILSYVWKYSLVCLALTGLGLLLIGLVIPRSV